LRFHFVVVNTELEKRLVALPLGTAPENRKVFVRRGHCHSHRRHLEHVLFAAPMVALYAISIVVAWLVNSNRERGAGAV
jgi:hypothetical protein